MTNCDVIIPGLLVGLSVQDLIHSLSPLPKVAASRSRKRKAECATLLTASPYKRLLEDKERAKTTKGKGRGSKGSAKVAKGKCKTKGKGKGRSTGKGIGKGKKRKKTKGSATKGKGVGQSSDEEEDEEWPCLICGEPFANSRSKETWVQCLACQQWAHEKSTTGESYFVRPNCESDEHSEDSDF